MAELASVCWPLFIEAKGSTWVTEDNDPARYSGGDRGQDVVPCVLWALRSIAEIPKIPKIPNDPKQWTPAKTMGPYGQLVHWPNGKQYNEWGVTFKGEASHCRRPRWLQCSPWWRAPETHKYTVVPEGVQHKSWQVSVAQLIGVSQVTSRLTFSITVLTSIPVVP